MCGRYPQSKRRREYVQPFGLTTPLPTFRHVEEREFQTYNLCPTRDSWVFRQKEDDVWADRLSWGFEATTLVINARAETALEKAMFEWSWSKARCVVPADGWYEWTRDQANQPHYFKRADDRPVYFAGLFRNERFVLLTEAAGEDFKQVHNRRPVALDPSRALEWMKPRQGDWSAQELREAMVPESEFTHHPVGYAVSKTSTDGPELLEPVSPAPSQLGLL